MKIVKLDLDYLSGPIYGEVYSIELHKSITGIELVDNDKILQELHNKIQDLFLSYYELDKNGQACWFNEEKKKADISKMLALVMQLKARLDEINDGSFEVVDLITPEYAKL